MKRLKWLDEKKDEIIRLHREEGWTNQQLAKHFNTSTGSINTRLRKWKSNVSDCNRNNRIEMDKEEIRRLYWDEELHPSQIAEKFGCCKQTITNKMIGWGIPFRTKSQARKGKLNPIYDVGHTEEARVKMSQAFVNGRTMGYNTHWGNGLYYNSPNQGKVFMRSSWEVKTADYLTSLGLDWYYEYEWLYVDDKTNYLPDFYIPSLDIYIEVKGRLKDSDVYKLDNVRKTRTVLLWDGEELLKLGIINNSGSAEINRKYRGVKQDWSYTKYIKN